MCIIAVIPSDKTITKETLSRCWQNNPHGGGFMYTDGKKVCIEKEMQSFKRYYKRFLNARNNNARSTFVVHFRISTHGKINETNCHPFSVNDKLAFAHNGIIYSVPNSPDYSDTVMFNNTILKVLPANFLTNDAILEMIRTYIGTGSKLAFLDARNNVTIINEKAGIWDDGIWYSNSGYKADRYYDRGGVKSDSVCDSKSKDYKQSKIGYQKEIKFKDFKKPETLIESVKESDWFGYTRSVRYDACDYCQGHLYTTGEKINGCCNKCLNDAVNGMTF